MFAYGLQVSQRRSSFVYSAGVRLVFEFLRKTRVKYRASEGKVKKEAEQQTLWSEKTQSNVP